MRHSRALGAVLGGFPGLPAAAQDPVPLYPENYTALEGWTAEIMVFKKVPE
ncbi:MAG TPA: hypothetical protein VFM88_05005 [Vicinamibacteria bacterium]|nr:hypothetical protein [Vicinamibacteria bacterium]